MRNSKQHFFTLAFVGCLCLVLSLGCSPSKENSNSRLNASPTTSPTTVVTSSSPASSPARSDTNTPTTARSPAFTPSATRENYNRLKTGMTYAQVVQILGKEGKVVGSEEKGGSKYVKYLWEGDAGADMNAVFQNDELLQVLVLLK